MTLVNPSLQVNSLGVVLSHFGLMLLISAAYFHFCNINQLHPVLSRHAAAIFGENAFRMPEDKASKVRTDFKLGDDKLKFCTMYNVQPRRRNPGVNYEQT